MRGRRRSGTEDGPDAMPAGLRPDDEGFVLCLGASYLHKNRPLRSSCGPS